jgi:uncharacterized membrane protein YdjX (TVP38/TMEM64 family)
MPDAEATTTTAATPPPTPITPATVAKGARDPGSAASRPSGGLKPALRRLGPAGPVAVIVTFLPGVGTVVVAALLVTHQSWLRAHQGESAWLHLVGFTVLGGLAIVPTNVNALVAGWTFGFAWGFALALTGTLAAAVIGYAMGRFVSQERVVQLVREHRKWRAVHGALLGGGFGKTVLVIGLWRVTPAVPFSLTNFALSSFRVPLAPYALGTALGVAPRTAVLVYAASRMTELTFEQAYNPWMIAAGAVVTVVVLAVIGAIARHALERVTGEADDGAVDGPAS